MRKLGLFLGTVLLSQVASASTIGVSSHPFTMQKQVIRTEFSNYGSNGAGSGINASYFKRLNERVNFDAGFGISDGKSASKVFAGADFELIPDYGRQPRISIKTLLDSQNYNGDRINSFGAAPTLSKGFSFWGNEAFPFVALPVKVGLNADDNTFQTSTALAAGITGRLPFAGFENLVANLETNIAIRNTNSSIVLGVSLPIQ